MMTTQETLELAAFLEVPHISDRVRSMRVHSSLDALGLRHVAHRAIGDANLGGARLSGGERRRLSVGLELMTASTPLLFVADESTTGLDSFQATKMVRLISNLAQERHIPAICSLHQPRASIWKLLDSVILLAPGGRVCYVGERHKAVDYFAQLGYPCPPETNPAEFLLDLVSIDTEDPQQADKDQSRITSLAKAFRESPQQLEWQQQQQQENHHHYKSSSSSNAASLHAIRGPWIIVRRFGALLRRSWRQNYRNTQYNFYRFVAAIGNAVLFSQIFKSVQSGVPNAKSIADRVALLSFGVINMSMVRMLRCVCVSAQLLYVFFLIVLNALCRWP